MSVAVASFAGTTSLSLRVDGIAPLEPLGPPNLGDERVIFGDEPVQVEVVFFHGSGDPKTRARSPIRLGRTFDESVQWEIRSATGERPPGLEIDLLETRVQRRGERLPLETVSEVRWGELVTATYRFAAIPRGTLSIRASVRDADGDVVATSPAVRLVAATGNESPALRALFLRNRTRHLEKDGIESTEVFERYSTMMRDLMALQPDDPGIPERLADASIGRAPAEETIALYDRALEVAEANLAARYGSIEVAPPKIARAWASRRDDLTSFRRIYPAAAAKPGELRIEIRSVGGVRKAALVDREGRLVPGPAAALRP